MKVPVLGSEPRPQDLTAALARDYAITAGSVVPHAGGWEADCFVVDDAWFVKAWRGEPPANLWVLDALAERGLTVAAPVHTVDGRLLASTYAVFPFVHGRPAPDDPELLARVLRQVHAVTDVELPVTTMDEPCVGFLRDHLDHPWVVERRDELAAAIDRLDAVIDRARRTDRPHVLVHNDLYGDNILVNDDDGEVAAILDWDHACLAPREHDLWILADTDRATGLLEAYGETDLDPTHLEYALLARALRDLAARVEAGADRPGVDTWGFRRVARVDAVLESVRARRP